MVRKKDNKKISILFMVISLFILLAYTSNNNLNRELKPLYDGDQNNFIIEIFDHAEHAEEGDLYWVDLEIQNDNNPGAMYVQCSLFDKEWEGFSNLYGLQSVTTLTSDNCVVDEPFTQTAYVTLGSLQKTILRFEMLTPNIANGKPFVYCEAFEQCSSNGDVMSSDKAIMDLEVKVKDGQSSNNNYMVDGEKCEEKNDCPGWLLSKVECVNGHCVDNKDIPNESNNLNIKIPSKLDISDETIQGWANEHKIIILLIAGLIFIVSAYFVFAEPKIQY